MEAQAVMPGAGHSVQLPVERSSHVPTAHETGASGVASATPPSAAVPTSSALSATGASAMASAAASTAESAGVESMPPSDGDPNAS